MTLCFVGPAREGSPGLREQAAGGSCGPAPAGRPEGHRDTRLCRKGEQRRRCTAALNPTADFGGLKAAAARSETHVVLAAVDASFWALLRGKAAHAELGALNSLAGLVRDV